MRVPLLDLKPQNTELDDELHAAFTRVLRSGQYILGREVEELERSAAALSGAKYGIGVSSGTDAILLALMALGIGPGDEVICPAFTFFATAGCIARTGAKPVFADCCPVCFNIDPNDIEHRITTRTKAIMPVHLFGQAAEMDHIMSIARSHELAVIEDAAQALGARYRNKGAGSMGTFGTFSFFPSKNLGGFGDSGLLVTSDDALAERARLLRTHGAETKYIHRLIGGNFRIDPMQAALLGVKLGRLAAYSKGRQSNAAYYTEHLSALPSVKAPCVSQGCCPHSSGTIKKAGGSERLAIILPTSKEHNEHIWNQYTMRIAAGARWDRPESPRDLLRKHLASQEIGCEIYYPIPLHLQECFTAQRTSAPEPLPVCETLARECLSIPIYPELTREQQGLVIQGIREFIQQNV